MLTSLIVAAGALLMTSAVLWLAERSAGSRADARAPH
jgi:hypothetical protein